MAKSLRSKRKRKFRAEKRIVNAKKELVKLQAIVSSFSKSNAKTAQANLSKFKELISSNIESGEHNFSSTGDLMEIDQNDPKEASSNQVTRAGGKVAKNPQSLSLKNEHGNYPVWLNKKKIKQIKQKIKRHNKNKVSKAGQIISRKAKKQLKRSATKSNKPKKP